MEALKVDIFDVKVQGVVSNGGPVIEGTSALETVRMRNTEMREKDELP